MTDALDTYQARTSDWESDVRELRVCEVAWPRESAQRGSSKLLKGFGVVFLGSEIDTTLTSAGLDSAHLEVIHMIGDP